MSSSPKGKSAGGEAVADDVDSLRQRLLRELYGERRSPSARRTADRLERALDAAPEFVGSARFEEARSLVAEARGDFAEAAKRREAELRKLLQLEALTASTPARAFVGRCYDPSDVADRFDLLAALYDRLGDVARAVEILGESRDYCRARGIPFDGQELLDELSRSPEHSSARPA